MKSKILVVDDQPGIRLLLNEVLTNEGYEVVEAGTGKEALEKIDEHSFDLMMIDYHLPIIDGSEVLQQLVDDKITIPVILMSGLTESIVFESESPDVIVEIVSKPFNIRYICDLVNSILT